MTCFHIFAGIKTNRLHDRLAPALLSDSVWPVIILIVNRRAEEVLQRLAESFSKEVHSQTRGPSGCCRLVQSLAKCTAWKGFKSSGREMEGERRNTTMTGMQPLVLLTCTSSVIKCHFTV